MSCSELKGLNGWSSFFKVWALRGPLNIYCQRRCLHQGKLLLTSLKVLQRFRKTRLLCVYFFPLNQDNHQCRKITYKFNTNKSKSTGSEDQCKPMPPFDSFGSFYQKTWLILSTDWCQILLYWLSTIKLKIDPFKVKHNNFPGVFAW